MSAGIIFEMSAWFPGFQEKAFVWCMIAWLVLTGIDVYDMEKSKRYLLKIRKNRRRAMTREDKRINTKKLRKEGCAGITQIKFWNLWRPIKSNRFY